MALPGIDVSVTVSVGVAGYPDHASTPDRLARLADAALYLAKRQGRNRVELAEPSVVGAFAEPGPSSLAGHIPEPRAGGTGNGNGNGQGSPDAAGQQQPARQRARDRG